MSTCKRMWTDREIRSMAVDSVENKSNLKVFENIVDKDGHKRFIEGDITIEEITGITKTYGKWSLSGSHLMVVLALSIANATAVSSGTKICDINLPEWIMDKITPLYGGNLSVSKFITLGAGTDTEIGYVLSKQTNAIRIAFNSGYTASRDEQTRLEFDLLIDNE